MKLKTLIIAPAIASTMVLGGCSTLFGSNDRTVHVDSVPQGATITLNGIEVGTTPSDIIVDSMKSFSPVITLNKDGYKTKASQIGSTFQPVGILNVLNGWGFIVDLITGDMMTLDQHDMKINLEKK